MGWRRPVSIAVVAGGLLALAAAPEAKTLVIPPRPGQVGLSIQGQYGTLLSSGGLGEDFANGPGLAVRIRYRMRYERAIGLSFEAQQFDVRTDATFTDPITGAPIPGDTTIAPARAKLITSGIDFYKLFGTRTNTTRMLSAGFGLAQVRFDLNDQETSFPPDGFYLSAGGEIERFFWRSWAWDLSVRYMALFQDGSTNHEFQAALGLIVYASY